MCTFYEYTQTNGYGRGKGVVTAKVLVFEQHSRTPNANVRSGTLFTQTHTLFCPANCEHSITHNINTIHTQTHI